MKSLAAAVASPPFLLGEGNADIHVHVERSFEALSLLASPARSLRHGG